MIIPTAEYDPMFADDGVPFREKMIDYIKREFSDTLGPRVGLLHANQGLDLLSALYVTSPSESARRSKAA